MSLLARKRRLVSSICLLGVFITPGIAAQKPPPVPEPLKAQGSVQVGFSPWEDVESMIVARIQAARREVLVQAYLLTSRRIAQALIAAHRRNVRVRVLADRGMVYGRGDRAADSDDANPQTRIPELRNAGIPVWLETRYAAAHNKIMVIDAASSQPVVITGSYNWTYSAQNRNAENVVVLRGNRALARRYQDNWERHRRDAIPYAP